MSASKSVAAQAETNGISKKYGRYRKEKFKEPSAHCGPQGRTQWPPPVIFLEMQLPVV